MTKTTYRIDVAGTYRWLVSIWIFLGISFLSLEVLGLNHFLRTWIQGNAYWVYIFSYLVIWGLVSSASLTIVSDLKRFSTWKWIGFGVGLGLLSSFLALSMNSPLLGNGFGPTWRAWRHPATQLMVIGLSMGWLYGAIIAFVAHSLVGRNYWRVAYFLLVCGGVRGLALTLSFFAERS